MDDMAHFAQIDDNNIVTNVIVVPDDQEHRGAEFCADDLGLGGTWIQTSYNNNIRKQFAGIGSVYNSDFDEFLDPQPYPSWVLDDSHDWQPPTLRPTENALEYRWNEETTSWVYRRVPDEIREGLVSAGLLT